MQISRRLVVIGALGSFLAACSHALAGAVPYSVGVSGEGNQVSIAQDSSGSGEAFIITVQSARGIGQASIAWWGDYSPHPLAFYMELSGLELFTLVWAEEAIAVSVNSMDQSVIQSVQTRDGAESTIAADSPYWMDIKLPTPERPGYLLSVPPAFVADRPRVWAIAWIDFYR